MQAQVKHANANSAALALDVEGLKQQLASAQAACRLSPASVLEQPLDDPLLSSSSGTFGSISNDIFADANRCVAFCHVAVSCLASAIHSDDSFANTYSWMAEHHSQQWPHQQECQ